MEHVHLLTAAEACDRLGIRKSHFFESVRKGVIPKPVKIGRSSRWRSDEIERFIEDRTQARDKVHKAERAGKVARLVAPAA